MVLEEMLTAAPLFKIPPPIPRVPVAELLETTALETFKVPT